MLLVSACLAGVCCRYDGTSKEVDWVKALVDNGLAITACPEQLGGLSTPRVPAALQDCDGADVLGGQGSVYDRAGQDVSAQFVLGAEKTLALARAVGVKEAILKARSPSCGYSPNRKGVTAALLEQAGITIYTEEGYKEK